MYKQSRLIFKAVLVVQCIFNIIGILHSTPISIATTIMQGNDGIEIDRVALLAIKSKIILDPHKVLQSWNDSLDICLWEGVTCGHRHKRVTRLNLTAKGIGGTLSPFVGNLSFLHYIALHENTFIGLVPPQLGRLTRLRTLDLHGNKFSGKIPFELSLLSKLQILALSDNNLTGNDLSPLSNLTYLRQLTLSVQTDKGGVGFQGTIPEFIGNFKHLTILALGGNSFTGKIPSSLYNLSNLQTLSLAENFLEGCLPPNLGFFFPQLQWLQLYNNHFSGTVPFSLSNISSLELLQLSDNNFTGKFLFDARNLRHLSILNISRANLGTGEARDLDFINTLVNCSRLKSLHIANNFFGGVLPQTIFHLSTKLQQLVLSDNQISGSIHPRLSHYINLELLYLGNNHLTGTIPLEIGKMSNLQKVFLSNNQLSGNIPSSLGDLNMLSRLDLSLNNFQGTIPATLSNCTSLLYLYLQHNNLVGNLPLNLLKTSSLIAVDLSNNRLQGSLPPEFGNLRQLVSLKIYKNNFTGALPITLGQCLELTYLDLSSNSFVGFIPPSFSLLKGLQEIDLSSNKLSGQLPTYFSNFSSLVVLNLSFNNLEGNVPTGEVFSNVNITDLVGNNKLCGGIPQLNFPTCPKAKSRKKKNLCLTVIIAISISCVLVGILTLYSIHILYSRRRRKRKTSSSLRVVQFKEPFIKASYAMLFKATCGFSTENLIGSGSYGSVYKGILCLDGEEKNIAVKVINNQRQGAHKSFTAECKALRTIRHRNLVRVITACSSIDFQGNLFRALVYEFMPKGSLERWLYSNSQEDNQASNLSLLQRLNIAIDVAHAIDYLHKGNDTPIVHCDLKPSNILLDEDMNAHVGDFGLVKLLPEVSEQLYSNSSSSNNSLTFRGTVGYVAPEYGLGAMVSTAGDVYSYGIILLELMTAKKPTDVMFEGGMSLQKFAEWALPARVFEIVDPELGVNGDDDDDNDDQERCINLNDTRGSISKCVFECITSIIMTGVRCSSELPQNRVEIKQVINELFSQRDRLLLCRRHRCQYVL